MHLIEVSKEQWIQSLKWGDIGLVKGRTFFGFLQDLLGKLEHVDKKASHGLIVKDAPIISEADGTRVWPANSICRYFSDHHKIWVFRNVNPISELQRSLGMAYLSGAEQASYGWAGIGEFVKRAWSIVRKKPYRPKDTLGLFCTEHCSRFARALKWIWVPGLEPQEISPSILLDWMLDVNRGDYALAAYYEFGKFYVAG